MDTTTTTTTTNVVVPKTGIVTTPLVTTDARTKKIENITSIGSTIGLVGGLVYAFKTKKGFWGYVGFGILGSVVLGMTSKVLARSFIKKVQEIIEVK
jgi:hypothetical protein